jgi:nitrous oxidase accessory protein NosD
MKTRTTTLLLALAGVTSSALYAETLNCTVISSLPYAINVPGVYCLKSDLTYSVGGFVDAISISADGVVFDLNAHSLTYLGPGGIDASGAIRSNASHTTIRNGAIRGFFSGVSLSNLTADSLVEDLQVEDSIIDGIVAQGRRHVVRHCRVSKTGVGNAITSHWGIEVYGPGHRVLDNDVNDTATTSTATSAGISVMNADDAVVENNRVVNTTGPTANAISITKSLVGGANVLVVGNRISVASTGIFFGAGTTGRYRDNLTMGALVPYVGGGDAGNNQ